MPGEGDKHIKTLEDQTLYLDEEGKRRCAGCDRIRYWNADPCWYCKRASQKRAAVFFLVVGLFVAAAFAAAALVPMDAEVSRLQSPSEISDSLSERLETLRDITVHWTEQYTEAECEACPECCGFESDAGEGDNSEEAVDVE